MTFTWTGKITICLLLLTSNSGYSRDRIDVPECKDPPNVSSTSNVSCEKKPTGEFTVSDKRNGEQFCFFKLHCKFGPGTVMYGSCPFGAGIWSSIDDWCWESEMVDMGEVSVKYPPGKKWCPDGTIWPSGNEDWIFGPAKALCLGQESLKKTGSGICCTERSRIPASVTPNKSNVITPSLLKAE